MPNALSVRGIILWFFVFILSVSVGGGLYEQFVVLPLWSLAPPDSVTEYVRHKAAYPQFALDEGRHFWMFVMPVTGLSAIATLISSFGTNPKHRKWRLAAGGLVLITIIATVTWFVPNIIKLRGPGVLAMNAEDVTNLTKMWVGLNWIRAAACIAGLLAGFKAMTVPSTRASII